MNSFEGEDNNSFNKKEKMFLYEFSCEKIQLMKFNMRETFLLTFLLVAIVPVVALSLFNYWTLDKYLNFYLDNWLNSALQDTQSIVSQDEQDLEAIAKSISYILEKINPIIKSKNKSELQSLLAKLKKSSYLDLLTVVDKNQVVIARANSTNFGDKAKFSKYIDDSLRGEVIVTPEIVTDETLKQEGIDLQGRTSLKYLNLNDPIESPQFDYSKGIFLLSFAPLYDEKKHEIIGSIVAGFLINDEYFNTRKGPQWPTKVNLSLLPYSNNIQSSKYSKITTLKDFDNKPIANLAVWTKPNNRVNVLSDTQRLSMIIYFITSCLVIVASFLVSEYLIRPMLLLDEATKEISKNNFDIKVDVKGPKEIENLGEAFNTMASTLSENRQMQEDFIATLTHDMRVPLLAEHKALDLIFNDDRFIFSDDQKLLLENMVNSNDDLLKLVNTLLDTYKLEAGKYALDLRYHNVEETIIEARNEIEPLIKEKNISIEFENTSHITTFKMDKYEIKRVLRNILSNAIKFTPEGGSIKIIQSSQDSNLIISISDNGQGMSGETLKNLFNRYYTGSSKKLKKVGTGLGLYLSYQIILAHKGLLWAESELNKGSTFYISLPEAPEIC